MNESSQGLGNFTKKSFANRTGCDLGLYRVMRKKQFELEGVANSTFTDLDLYINKTDLKSLSGEFIDFCYDENEFAVLKTIAHHLWKTVSHVYFGFGALGNLLIIIYFLQLYRKTVSRMSAYHFIIANIAISDLLVCSIMINISFKTTSTCYVCHLNNKHRMDWIFNNCIRVYNSL